MPPGSQRRPISTNFATRPAVAGYDARTHVPITAESPPQVFRTGVSGTIGILNSSTSCDGRRQECQMWPPRCAEPTGPPGGLCANLLQKGRELATHKLGSTRGRSPRSDFLVSSPPRRPSRPRCRAAPCRPRPDVEHLPVVSLRLDSVAPQLRRPGERREPRSARLLHVSKSFSVSVDTLCREQTDEGPALERTRSIQARPRP